MSNDNNIPEASADDLPYADAEISDKGNLENLDDIDIEAPEKDIVDIAVPKDKPLKRFLRGVGKAIKGENSAGKKGKHVLDIIGVFVPPVAKIRSASKGILGMNKSKQINSQMKEPKLEKIKRYLKQKSTQTAIAFIATAASAIFAGVEINPEILTESLVGIVAGVSAVWAGVMTVVEMFRDEDSE